MSNITPQDWYNALISGKYERGTSRLATLDEGQPDRYCCLGVLAKEMGILKDPQAGYLIENQMPEWLKNVEAHKEWGYQPGLADVNDNNHVGPDWSEVKGDACESVLDLIKKYWPEVSD